VTDGVQIALITVIGAVIVAMIERVHRLVNSRMTEMLEIAKQSSHAEGMKDEQTNERSRAAQKKRKQ
jgi:hypothetical protein